MAMHLRNSLRVSCFLAVVLLGLQTGTATAQKAAAANPAPSDQATILYDGALLPAIKMHPDPALLKHITAEADAAMTARMKSVMDKTQTPPSGDKHDYMSQAPYFWPNPDTPNHLPYIRKDGIRNPEIKGIRDHDAFTSTQKNIHALALGFYFTGNKAYAERAALLLRAFFLDPATRMNPNLRFAQAIPGVNDGRGTGILDVKEFAQTVDALSLLRGASAWTPADDAALHTWMETYFTWLTTSKNGRDEAAAKNNHGTWYDVQQIAIAIYLGKRDVVQQIAETARTKRIGIQIEPGGEQPLETARTKSFGYSVMNLTGLTELAAICHSQGYDLWSYTSARGGSIRVAINYLLPFALGQATWTKQNVLGLHTDTLPEPLLRAAIAFHDTRYEDLAKQFGAPDDADSLLLQQQFAASMPDLKAKGAKAR